MADDDVIDLRGSVLTPETFKQAIEIMLAYHERPYVEIHHPKCEKVTGRSLFCNCGTCPLDPEFKKRLEKP